MQHRCPRLQRAVVKALATVCILATISCMTGCLRRSLRVTSAPEGAQLYINNVYRGRTPVDIPYNWNWFYDVKLEAPGHDTMVVRERLYAPPRHVIGPDLLAELMPWGSREDPARHYVLRPMKQP